MTNNTTPSGTCIESSHYPTEHSAYAAFDKILNTRWHSNTSAPSYVGYKFVNPVVVRLCSFIVYANDTLYPDRSLTIKIQASNDGNTWNDLSSENTYFLNTTLHLLKLNNNKPYLYYRAYFTDTDPDDYCFIYELQFYGR